MKATKIDGILREVGGKTVLIPISSESARKGMFFQLNELGKRIWDIIDNCDEIELDAIYETIYNEFDSPLEIIRNDIDTFLTALSDRQLIRIDK
jgi:hypothetical protein